MKYRVAHHDASFVSGGVGELVAAADVTGSKNVFLIGAQPRIHRNTPAVEFHTGSVQPQIVDVDRTAQGHQHRVGCQRHRGAVSQPQGNAFFLTCRRCRFNGGTQVKFYALGLHDRLDGIGHVRVLLG